MATETREVKGYMDYFGGSPNNNNDGRGNGDPYFGGSSGNYHDGRGTEDPYFGYLPPRPSRPQPSYDTVSRADFKAYKRKVNTVIIVIAIIAAILFGVFFSVVPTIVADKISANVAELAAEKAAEMISQEILDQYKRDYNLPEDYFGIGAYVAKNCIKSVVVINCSTSSAGSQSTASGIIISDDGYILTNAHVILQENGTRFTRISAQMYDSGTTYSLTYVSHNSSKDLALLKFSDTVRPVNFSAVTFADSNLLTLGEEVAILGNADGLGIAVSTGVVSQLVRSLTSDSGWTITGDVLQTTAAVNPGNSGGPIFNINGECIGVVAAKIASTNVEGIGFAIASNFALKWVDSLSKGVKYKTVKY
ncbi:MAG: trypsin-like peptidase domain-containing protein [Clostridiaceae bacterium]|jgi:serine protease Do|nr:trypsin-like peptidase domain-containing protein [Clostridiaceae bacterium]